MRSGRSSIWFAHHLGPKRGEQSRSGVGEEGGSWPYRSGRDLLVILCGEPLLPALDRLLLVAARGEFAPYRCIFTELNTAIRSAHRGLLNTLTDCSRGSGAIFATVRRVRRCCHEPCPSDPTPGVASLICMFSRFPMESALNRFRSR